MYEKISTELFSSIITKINQIPNYSTPYKKKPSSKQSQKLTQIYYLYSIEPSQQEIFYKIFSHIHDHSLKNNLANIMYTIGTKYNSFSVSDTNSILIKYANDELLSLFADTWNYFNRKTEYLKSIEIEENQIGSDEFLEYEASFLETICFTCGLINIVIFMFKKQFSVLDNFNKKLNISKLKESVNKVNPQINKETVQTEINTLFIINKNRVWLEPLITLLEQILKFFLGCNFYKVISTKLEKYRKKEKEGRITQEDIIKNIDKYINYLIDDNNTLKKIFTLVIRYTALNNINVLTGSIIQINSLNSLIQRFFNIYIIFLMNQNMVGVYYTEEELYCLGINIIECLLNAKYKDKNYGIDFMNYFYSMQAFLEDVFDEINIKIINGINELFACIKSGSMNISMSDLNLLQKLENTLRDYLLYTLISSNNKDSLCDCYFHYLPHRQIFINFGLLRTYLLMLKNIRKNMSYDKSNKYNNNITEKKKEIIIGNIFDDLMNELRKYNIILPVKMFLFKSYFIQSIMAVLYKCVKLFNNYILDANTDKLIFYNNISIIKEMTDSINCTFFLLGNDILTYLKFPANYKNINNEINKQVINPVLLPSLRIFDGKNAIDFFNIIQERLPKPNCQKNKIHSQKIKNDFPLTSNSILNKMNSVFKKNEPSNSPGNLPLLNSNKKPRNTIISGIFDTNFTENLDLDLDESFDNDNYVRNSIQNDNKSGFSFIPSTIFKSNIIKSEDKRRSSTSSDFIYRYDITSIINSIKKEIIPSLNKIGYEYKIENDIHYLYINQEEDINPNISQIICFENNKATGLFSLKNPKIYKLIKDDPLSSKLIEQLYMNYLDGIDDSNIGKAIEISLKYYDIDNKLDYFNFVEKCKKLIC